MNIKSHALFIGLLLVALCFSACTNTTETPQDSPLSIDVPIPDNTLAYFLQQCQEVAPGTAISSELSEKFIQPALAENTLHPYLPTDKATYSYGQILYEDSAIVAFTFYYKATNHKNLLAASFLATFNRPKEQFIATKMVFGSSTFDFQTTKGYNMGYACKSDIEFLESDRLVLRLKSQIKQLYSNFKENIDPIPNVNQSHRYSLLKNGEFVFE